MKVAFLDRDGVINKFPGNGNYVTKVKDFHFIPGSLEAIRLLTEAGFILFVISNQAGVGKGVYTKKKLDQITDKLLIAVKKTGGRIKKIFYCTHRSDAGCDCRKPEIGNVKKALLMIKKPMRFIKDSYFVGDTVSDIVTGQRAGAKTIFVLSGRSDQKRLRQKGIKPNYVVKNLREAAKIILSEKKS